MRTKDYLIAGVIIAVLIGLFIGFSNKTEQLGGVKMGQRMLLDNATTTQLNVAGKKVDVGEYNTCIVTVYIKNIASQKANDKYTFKFRGSYSDDEPDFFSVATSSEVHASSTSASTITSSGYNLWEYIPATRLITGLAITASAGTSTTPNETSYSFSIDKKVKWLGMAVSTASTTASNFATTTLNAFVNCEK